MNKTFACCFSACLFAQLISTAQSVLCLFVQDLYLLKHLSQRDLSEGRMPGKCSQRLTDRFQKTQSVWCIGMWLMCMLCVKMNLVNLVEPLKTHPVACVCWKHVFNKVMHAYLGWSRS